MTTYLAFMIWGALAGLLVGYGLGRSGVKQWREAALRWREAAELYERIR